MSELEFIMASRTERRYYQHSPNHYRNLFMSKYIGKGPRRGWFGTGIAAESRSEPADENGDNPFISLLMVLVAVTLCFIMSIPILLLARLLQ